MLFRNRCAGLRCDAASVRRLVRTLDATLPHPAPPGELSIVVLDAAAMARLHADFMDDPSPTDVITFDGDPAFGVAGEICVCADVAHNYAAAHGVGFARELALYVAHGYLHLGGFDDTSAPKRRRMRAAEKEAMRNLEDAKAIPRVSWKAGRRPRGA